MEPALQDSTKARTRERSPCSGENLVLRFWSTAAKNWSRRDCIVRRDNLRRCRLVDTGEEEEEGIGGRKA